MIYVFFYVSKFFTFTSREAGKAVSVRAKKRSERERLFTHS